MLSLHNTLFILVRSYSSLLLIHVLVVVVRYHLNLDVEWNILIVSGEQIVEHGYSVQLELRSYLRRYLRHNTTTNT
jgi:hypothetical protein